MKKINFYPILSALFVGGMALSAVSCADNNLDEENNGGEQELAVKFNVSDAQDEPTNNSTSTTRGVTASGVALADLKGQTLEAQSADNLDVCLVETTVEGINPVQKPVATRANIINMSNFTDFSSAGLRGTAANSINTEWFHNAKTRPNGKLYNYYPWSWDQPSARFYAVYPEISKYNAMTISKATATASPTVEFQVKPNVQDQVDLMTACSGDVRYVTRGRAPQTNLKFRHALTAIRFAVGQNLSFDKTITKITLKNVLLKSKYVLSNKYDGTGAKWNHTGYNTRGDVSLAGLSYKTNEDPNSIVRNQNTYRTENDILKLNDGYTFYMIPQDLTGKVTAEVLFSDNSKITVPLTGAWKEGTTRTYKLSQKNSTWTYTLLTESPKAAAFNATATDKYKITSYREAPDGTKKAVAWKVIGYDANGDGNFSMTEKPSWLGNLKTEGNGGERAEETTASLVPSAVVDLVAQRNKELKNAKALGSNGAPYNLSNSTGAATVENTANSYVISAPGVYMFPLVYGNAIKDGRTNRSAYLGNVSTLNVPVNRQIKNVILQNLVDHNGIGITDPWIEKTNNRANNGVNAAQIVWTDEANIVRSNAVSIYRDGSGNAFVKFEVKQADIKSGNTVIAVKKGNTIVWSWHLWFAPKDALEKVAVTNKDDKVYNFTKETLGWKPITWTGTPYTSTREVKVKIEQTVGHTGQKEISYVTIKQRPTTSAIEGITTLYQWGRKDAFPGLSGNVAGVNRTPGDKIYLQAIIQNPGNFYITRLSGGAIDGGSYLTQYYNFYNLWSINNTKTGGQDNGNDDPVIKTIYDPSPVGFTVPGGNAFTGFTETGRNRATMNVDGTGVKSVFDANMGHHYWTNSNKEETIFFPAAGYMDNGNGALLWHKQYGDFWTALPADINNGCVMGIQHDFTYPRFVNVRTYGFSIRPAAE
ncbi:hypothetical protein [Hoylesella nanceiensis]|uniref:hypothetical protein n=1 Tax=Hoylesella nanceiensis TaxID=425941 RepID=UPI00242F9803|nr:hypothetical protein [Hoylesella nanceiensis]